MSEGMFLSIIFVTQYSSNGSTSSINLRNEDCFFKNNDQSRAVIPEANFPQIYHLVRKLSYPGSIVPCTALVFLNPGSNTRSPKTQGFWAVAAALIKHMVLNHEKSISSLSIL